MLNRVAGTSYQDETGSGSGLKPGQVCNIASPYFNVGACYRMTIPAYPLACRLYLPRISDDYFQICLVFFSSAC